MPKTVVYRVQDIPATFSEEDAKQAILSLLEEDESPEMLQDCALFPFCQAQIPGNVALIKLNQTPRFLAPLAGDLSKFHVVRIDRQTRLKFDRNFLGFTQLNWPDGTQGIAADIVAITGIDGHAYGSWRNSEADFMWIEEGLPNQFPQCRVLLYGYDSKIESRNTNRLSDYCIGLREQLGRIRESEEERTRPVFFIGHSFGGIIAANTLIQAATDRDRSLYNAIEAFIFFGTPHGGLIMDGIRKMLSDKSHPRNILLDQIDVKKEFLPDQLLTFKNVLGERVAASFYETKQTRELQQDEKGRWARTGEYMHLSNRAGSILGLPDSQESKYPVDEDHSRMVKFESPTNPAYLKAVQYLKGFLQSAQGKVLMRSDPMYNPRELIEWLSDVDFRAWEGKRFKPREVAPLGDGFLRSQGFKFWEEQQVSQLECYGAVGSGKTYLAYVVSTRLRETKKNTCVVSVYIEPNDPTMTVERLLGAMLKQVLESRGSRAIATNLQQYHQVESYKRQKPQKKELIEFLAEGVQKYDYAYFVVDGFHDASTDIQDGLFDAVDQIRERTNRIGVLYFKREDELVPSTLPFCDNCGKVARVHYRCEECPSPFFDLCPSCNERDDGSLRCNPSHSLILDPDVIMILPARVEEMKRFMDFMINSLIKSAGPRQGTSNRHRRPANTSVLAKLCLEPSNQTPDLRREIVENISLRLWGLNFRAAQEWFNRLKLQPTRGGIMENISQIPWRGSSTYRTDLNQLQTDETHAEDQAGWRIVSLVMAARRTLKQEDLRTAEAALRLRKLEEKYMDKMDHSRMIFLSKGLITIIQDPNQNVVADPPFYDFFHSLERGPGSQSREAHYNMASACLNYLRLDKLLESSKSDVNKKFWEEPFLAYAACFWGEHVRLAESKDLDSKARDLLQDQQRFAALLKAAWTCSLPAQASLRWDVNSGLHALHVCAWFGLASLIPMVRGKSSIDELEPSYNQTPLMYASRKGHESAVVALLDAGADPTRFSGKGYNALFEAVTVHEPSQRDSKIRIAKRLLDDGRTDIHATHPASKHRTALHIAARQGEEYASLVDMLISYGADPNRIDDRGWTPIMCAARLGRERIVESLLEAPVDVDLFGSQWNFKTTALHLAIEGGHQGITVRLLARGAEPWLRDIWGLDVEAKAKRKGLQKAVDLIAEQRTLGSGSPTVDEIQPAPLETHALHYAVSERCLSRVKAFLMTDPSLALTKDQCGRTPLHLAVNNCNRHLFRTMNASDITMAKLLVSHSDPAATDRWGLRVMDYAIYNRRGFMQVELLDAGVEFDAHLSDDLNLLLSLAYQDGKAHAMTRLFAKGADEFQAYPLVAPRLLENGNVEDLQKYKHPAAPGLRNGISRAVASQKVMGYSDNSLKGQGVKRSFAHHEEDEAKKKGRFT